MNSALEIAGGKAAFGGRPWHSRPVWALLLFGLPFAMAYLHGDLFIDDAFITFRYARNIALGRGFVYNSEPILGTTAAFYCLLLAAGRLAAIPIEHAALFIGTASAGGATVLVWRAGMLSPRPLAGLIGGLLLALSPTWWFNSKTGMETTLAGFLMVLAIYLDLKKRGALTGAACAALVLTRPDTALLPVIIFARLLVLDRPRALRFAVAGGALVLPWLVFAALYFGSPAPHSLPAKKLIHAFPFLRGLWKYAGWYLGVLGPWHMGVCVLAWIGGTVFAARKWRDGLVALCWPPIFILALASTRVGPFFWYKVPVLPLVFLGAGLGLAWPIGGPGAAAESFGDTSGGRRRAMLARSAGMVFFAVMVGGMLFRAWPFLLDAEKVRLQVHKESILFEQAKAIRDDMDKVGLDPSSARVFAGEVGVIGWVLEDSVIIDSAGINSDRVLEIRRRDYERLGNVDWGLGEEGWERKWSGTPGWSREVIDEFNPEYITSNMQYLHLLTLAREDWFRESYVLIDKRQDTLGNDFVVLRRRDLAEGGGGEAVR